MYKYALLALLLSSTVLGMENQLTICTNEDELRAIEIIYTTQNSVPCKVNYTKHSKNQILWQAQYSEGYCEEKAAAFVDDLRKWGWNCRSVLGEPVQ